MRHCYAQDILAKSDDSKAQIACLHIDPIGKRSHYGSADNRK